MFIQPIRASVSTCYAYLFPIAQPSTLAMFPLSELNLRLAWYIIVAWSEYGVHVFGARYNQIMGNDGRTSR